MVDLTTVETPIGYVDLARVHLNAERTAMYAAESGLGWRPHIKSHKSRAIARIQLEKGAIGLTVATLREAEVMASLTDDILLAYPPVGDARLERLLRLPASIDLKVGLDSLDVLTPLATAAVKAGRSVGVLIEEDLGLGRVGVTGPDEVIRLANAAESLEGVNFRGLMFYPGHIRMSVPEQVIHQEALNGRLIRTLSALREEGLNPEIISGGSTPTLWRSHEIQGLTEIRAGSCIFFDREALEVGVASVENLAYTVLATVISTAVPGQAVVDAGSKALAKESRSGEAGFGILLDRPDVVVSSVSEEHGVLDVSSTDWHPKIGERVRIVPNHVCVSVNLQEELLTRDGGTHRLLEIEARGRRHWSN